MAFVVFLRGVNVGGKTFKPTETAKALAPLDATSLGAAGTFIVRGRTTPSALAKRFQESLPFEADVLVRPADEVAALVARAPFLPLPADGRPFVSVLATEPKQLPPFPLDRPEGAPWEVRLLGIEGAYALSLRRTTGGKFYPNEVVEKTLGVRATTRSWSTMEALAKKLGDA